MMTVLEYAIDVNKTVEEILKKCKELNIDVTSESDLLDDTAITELDNTIDNTEELEDLVEEIIEKKDIEVDNVVKKEKLKKKNDYVNKKNQKELAKEKKEMYKHKEKLMSNKPVTDEKVILYKDNMTIAELAKSLGVPSAELVKKLFNLGVIATLNTSISFENAELLVVDYDKELKREETVDVTNFEEYEIKDLDSDLVSAI